LTLRAEEKILKDNTENKLFTFSNDWQNNAVINMFYGHDNKYISGYGEAALFLAKHIISTNKNQDSFVFPIVFLFRHYIELRLKKLVTYGKQILREDIFFNKDHGIKEYKDTVLKTLSTICLTETQPIDEVISLSDRNKLEFIIEEFCKADPDGQAFRYSTTKKGKQNLTGIDYINIRSFTENICSLDESFDRIENFYSMILDYRSQSI
jgi:hypothetical protein